ncbi:hypothetical protein A3L04_09270 [Thermococcus chitonophagus]|uniref:Integral membrane protein n=2 Tax=Thermococcus chitonophagus TaxID=54262 RepID=A0A160VSK3_9EURY|nr:hypothetical protein A3L04_09270 [Thermococcus chitonophagus]CUX77862.1 hypothetical protein CHITON_1083 [Thermococcus chitonophagus]
MIFLSLAVTTYLISTFLFGVRWKFVLKSLGYDVELLECVKGVFVGQFFNNITPTSRSGGEIARAFLLKMKHGIPLDASIMSIIYERILEFVPVFGMFVVSMNYLALKFPKIKVLIYILSILVPLAWLNLEKIVEVASRFLNRAMNIDVKRLKKDVRANIVGITTSSVVWVLDVLRIKLISMALSIPFSIKIAVLISLAGLILSLLAITPGGIGIVEGGLIGFLVFLGVPVSAALKFVAIERFISYGLGTIGGGIITILEGGSSLWKALKSR